MPIAVTAVTLYIVVVGIDTTAQTLFGVVWRNNVGPL